MQFVPSKILFPALGNWQEFRVWPRDFCRKFMIQFYIGSSNLYSFPLLLTFNLSCFRIPSSRSGGVHSPAGFRNLPGETRITFV
ncbi:predicted protein [Methanosarcina acetivorans C2A]|uniref:Uncharacterized protein n=1 Tax=Methanosarcina acetivorans (strain ATCC 35395 / DSM 2834 / JCM 12185 / C2A) TaxID=188937 RepID=Q8TJZ7_METAC|nr:predicted protein [Methanosarcina acetivorans C2A]